MQSLVQITRYTLCLGQYKTAGSRQVCSGWDVLRTTGGTPLLVPVSGVGCWNPSEEDSGDGTKKYMSLRLWWRWGEQTLWVVGVLVCHVYLGLLFIADKYMAWVLEKGV